VFCILLIDFSPKKNWGASKLKMADSDTDSDGSFHGFNADAGGDFAPRLGLGDSGQSDVSVSSVHTSDLSDWSDHSSISVASSDEDEFVDSDAEWSDSISDWEEESFNESVGPKFPLPLDAKPLDYFLLVLLFPEHMFEKLHDS
jgi:hypothetical protein